MAEQHFIDPKMSLAEVSNFLKETVFSIDNVKQVEDKVAGDFERNRRQFLRWAENPKGELFKIFDSITCKDNCPIPLIGFPYQSRDSHRPSVMFYATVLYRSYKLVAALINNNVEFFTQHSIDRYKERFQGELVPNGQINSIGRMLIYNNISLICNYNDNNHREIYSIVRDGIFICANKQGVLLRKTFIAPDMFAAEQRRFYNRQLPALNGLLKQEGRPTTVMAA